MRRVFVVIVLAVLASGCSKSSPTSPSTTSNPTTPVAVALSSISVSVTSSTLLVGSTTQVQVTAKYSDNTSKLVTAEELTSSSPSVATVNPSGIVTAVQTGASSITAKYQGMSGTASVSVLPPISDAAKALVVNFNLNQMNNLGTVKRWASGVTIRVYADPGFRRQDLVDATNLWTTTTSGKIVFAIVDDPTSANIVFTFDSTITGVCGYEGPDGFTGSVITHGSGRYATRSECAGNGEHKIGLAHGLGHILWIAGHTASGTNLMGSPNSIWLMSPLLSDATNWIYSVPPGTRPQ